MNIQKYNHRLPALRVSKTLSIMLKAQALAQNITLAEAHRQMLAKGLISEQINLIPIKGEVKGENITEVQNA